MSSKKTKKTADDENFAYIGRLIEICGSSQPSKVARLLNISYQAAKNYLQGRLPDSNVLSAIAEQTPYSIHWLLTGQGKKLVEKAIGEDTLPLSDQLREFVRKECRELINELINGHSIPVQAKTVVLTSEQVMQEKVLKESVTFSAKPQK
jgi:predicted transcriptional regulator